ncbi:MAG: tetratricopeptide repeat protein [Vulcanimicrobiota bacterium]
MEKQIEIFEDHFESYLLWKKGNIRDIAVIHFDAHLDYRDADLREDTLQKILEDEESGTLAETSNSEKFFWNGLHPGNYLYPAACRGIFNRLIWVIPPFLCKKEELLPWSREELRRWKDITIKEFAGFHLKNGMAVSQIHNKEFKVGFLEDLIPMEGPYVLDIDVDYFLDEITDLPWISPFGFVKKVNQIFPAPQAVYISHSVSGGYTSPWNKYYGDLLKLAFENRIDSELIEGYKKLVEGDKIQTEDADGAYKLWREAEKVGFFKPYVWLRIMNRVDGEEKTRYMNLIEQNRPDLLISDIDKAMVLYRKKDYKQAFKMFKELEKKDDKRFILANMVCAMIHMESKQYERSLNHWQKIIRSLVFEAMEIGNKTNILLQQGRCMYEADLLEQAIAVLSQIIKLEPSRHKAYFYRGKAYRRRGNFKKAARDFRKFLLLQPEKFDSLEVHLLLGNTYNDMNKKSLAKNEFKKLEQKDATGLYRMRATLGQVFGRSVDS